MQRYEIAIHTGFYHVYRCPQPQRSTFNREPRCLRPTSPRPENRPAFEKSFGICPRPHPRQIERAGLRASHSSSRKSASDFSGWGAIVWRAEADRRAMPETQHRSVVVDRPTWRDLLRDLSVHLSTPDISYASLFVPLVQRHVYICPRIPIATAGACSSVVCGRAVRAGRQLALGAESGPGSRVRRAPQPLGSCPC